MACPGNVVERMLSATHRRSWTDATASGLLAILTQVASHASLFPDLRDVAQGRIEGGRSQKSEVRSREGEGRPARTAGPGP